MVDLSEINKSHSQNSLIFCSEYCDMSLGIGRCNFLLEAINNGDVEQVLRSKLHVVFAQ